MPLAPRWLRRRGTRFVLEAPQNLDIDRCFDIMQEWRRARATGQDILLTGGVTVKEVSR